MASTIIIAEAQALRPIDAYRITLGAGSAAATQTIGSQIVRLNTDAACHFNLEGGVASTATSPRMSADMTEYFKVQVQSPAQAITAIWDGTAGTLYITECG